MAERPLPETVDEAIQYLLSLLDETSQNNLKNMKRDDLGDLHHTYGAGVRHALGLWGTNPKLCANPEIVGMHPDDASIYIIKRMWDYLNSQAKN